MTATTTGLSTAEFTHLRIADVNGEMTDILTLLGGGTGSDITSVTGVGAVSVTSTGGEREISVDLSPYATTGALSSGITQALLPYSTTVAIAAEALKAKGVYNKNKLFGVTTLDVIRSETFVGNLKGLNPANLHVPVIGGHSGTTILPLLSQVKGVEFTDEEVASLTTRIQNAGTEVVEAKAGGGSATLSMGHAAARFCLSLVAAMRGENVGEYTYVETNSDDAEFFAHPVRLGKNGLEEILSYGELSEFEENAKNAMLDGLRADIAMGVEFVKG